MISSILTTHPSIRRTVASAITALALVATAVGTSVPASAANNDGSIAIVPSSTVVPPLTPIVLNVTVTCPTYSGGTGLVLDISDSAGGSSQWTEVDGFASNNNHTWMWAIDATAQEPLGSQTFTASVTGRPCVLAGKTASATITVANVSVPDAPTVTSVTAGNGSASVSFTAPANTGGLPVTDYLYSLDGATFASAGLTSPFTISGLPNDVAQTVVLVARNDAGDSAPSNAFPFTPVGPPYAPTDVVITPQSGALDVSFTSPADPANLITSYEYSLNGGAWVSWNSTALTQTISGLTNGTSYTVSVRARNSRGAGIATSPVTGIPTGLPDAPTNVVVSPMGTTPPLDTQLSVSFTAAVNNGSAITNYWYSLDGTNYVSANSASTTIVIAGLTALQPYAVWVKSENALGLSDASTPAFGIPASTVPSAPLSLSTAPSNSSVIVSFTATSVPDADGAQYSVDGGTAIDATNWVFDSQTGTYGVLVDALTNGTPYSIRVRLSNANGWGSWSAAVIGIPSTIPDAPSFSLTPGNQSLTVNVTPGYDGGNAITSYSYSTDGGNTFTSTGNATTPITISGLTNGLTYDVVLIATNGNGDSGASATVSAAPSGKPGLPTVSSIGHGNQTLTVNGTGAVANGSNILRYEYTFNGGTTVTSAGLMPALPFTITGLTNGTSYSVQIRAVNANGNGNWTTAVDATPSTTPGLPTVSSIGHGDQTLTVNGTGAAANGSALIRYEYTFNGGTTVTSAGTTALPFTISGLTNGASYSVQIRAVNGDGPGSWTTAVDATPSTIPGLPTVSSIGHGNQTLTVNGTDAAANGADIRYEYTFNGGTAVRDAGTKTLPFTITGLSNGTSYSVQIRAVNANGNGNWTTAVDATPSTAPSVLNSTITHGDAYIKIDGTISDGGSAITGYQYQLDGGSAIDFGSLPFTITGLTNGQQYSVRLRAVNSADGAGAWSSAVITSPGTTPNAPTNLAMSSGNRSLTVYFDVPVANGTAITDYEYSTDNGLTFVSAHKANSPITITTMSSSGHATLAVGHSYEVVLRAVNDAGAGQSSTSIVGITNDVPGSPSGVIATAGNASISVSFTAPQDGGSAITRYEYSINGGTTVVSTGSTMSPFTIASLTNGTSYTVKVRAVNANGASAWATAAAVTPKAPTVLGTWQTKAATRSYLTVVTSAGTHSIVVKTTTPKACVVKGYNVYFLMSGTCTVTVTQDGQVLRTLNSSVAKTNALIAPAKAQRITSINMTTKGTTLDAGTKKALDKLVANLRKSAIVIVYGCAAKNSSTAVTAANRATAVASYLKSKGVSVASFAGYGSTIAASGKALKDRVDLGTA